MVKVNPGLSQILSEVSLSKNTRAYKNAVEPLPRVTVMTTQNVTSSNIQESEYIKWNKILILG